ncbi:MAG: hypothetical protein JRD39_07450 [Deltaproteobacteria bacterium]|jgi:predicted RNA-binding Zn-ribbon protein involved in translation (DUF1610 family)|nr:hypothetical protein [Deltaproteobacteria bacterium]
MEMGTNDKIETIPAEGEIYACPSCGYRDGFHVSFKVRPGTSKADICLICPNCHRRFFINWQADLAAE